MSEFHEADVSVRLILNEISDSRIDGQERGLDRLGDEQMVFSGQGCELERFLFMQNKRLFDDDMLARQQGFFRIRIMHGID